MVIFNKSEGSKTLQAARILRTRAVGGVAIPGIIHNGEYYFTDLLVYEDGLISCWQAADLESVKNEINRGWIATSVPDTRNISVHGLGMWEVSNGSWIHDKKGLYDLIRGIVESMNPEMRNLYEHVEKKINGVPYLESGRGSSFREVHRFERDPFPVTENGESFHAFQKSDDTYFLARLTVFRDGSIEVGWTRNDSVLDYSIFEDLVREGEFLTEPPQGATVTIDGLGSFEIAAVRYSVSIENKMLEIKDLIRSLKGESTSLNICKTLYDEFLINPTRAVRDELQAAYESIPEHNRIYVLGDMDDRDIPVRMIIYGDDEVEVSKPKDE